MKRAFIVFAIILFLGAAQAELPTLIYLVKRANPRTVEFSSDDYSTGFRLLRALIALAGISYN